ncbi:MAG: antitoxin VapB family protein [Euryarchaeota archaeon]|nr:antitoxin VapB family protein [Euryarchaeota archaeon]
MRTIGLSEDAYSMLDNAKRPGESFSDVVRRAFSADRLLAMVGTMTQDTAAHYKRVIARARGQEDRESERRARRMRR